MNQSEAIRLFEEANRLWFEGGQYNKALPLYEKALTQEPSEPIILYQLANVLWAFERFDEVQELVATIEQCKDNFSELGKTIFTEEKSRLLALAPFKLSLLVSLDQIDMEQIELMNFSHLKWMDMAFAAEERKLLQLAIYAHDLSFPFTDFDNERYKQELRRENDWLLSLLEQMK